MIVSGVRPYSYVRGKFTLQQNEVIGYSGILFEEPMFSVLAEKEIYGSVSGTNRKYTKYINKEGNVFALFEPKSDGSNLDGTNTDTTLSGIEAGPGCINYIDYIIDIRNSISGLLTESIIIDTEYSGIEIIRDYFKANNFFSNYETWTHPADNNVSGLGVSGGIYDIDLREIQYQPYVRVSKFLPTSVSGIVIPTTPIAPMFCSLDGTIVKTSTRDLEHSAQMDGNSLYAYTAAIANKLGVFGDIIVPNDTRLYLAWTSGNLSDNSTGVCTQIFPRTINNDLGSGFGMFTPPTLNVSSGIYGIQVFNTDPLIQGQTVPVSGEIGIWPKLSRIVSSGYQRATLSDGSNEVFTSGFHIFKTGLWSHSPSGARLSSPINGEILWYRFADNSSWTTTNFGPKRWLDIGGRPAMPIVGGNQNLIFVMGITADIDPDPTLADRRFVFSVYNPSTLDFISATESNKILTSTSPPSTDAFFYAYNHNPASGVNISNHWVISEVAGLSSGPEVYILDSSMNNIAAWDTATAPGNAPICMINGNLYGFNPSQTSASGATFIWNHVVLEDPFGNWPPPPSSGRILGDAISHEIRDTVYDNTNGIAELFEPINPNNFSFGGIPIVMDPRGTDLDYGDGSVLIRFNAKMKGETTLKTFMGRIKEDTIGGNDVLNIFEFKPLKHTSFGWVYGIN